MKKWMLAVTLISSTAFSATDLYVKKATEQVSAARMDLVRLEQTATLNQLELIQNLSRRLEFAEKNLFQSLTEIPTHPSPPRYGSLMQAKCEIDDDPDFNPGQFDAGVLKGYSIDQIMGDCEALAKSRYPRTYSFGISQLTIIQQVPGDVVATCQIDDDPKFDPDQVNVGEIAGPDFLSIMEQCQRLADITYKGNGSAGIKNPKINASEFRVTATCHLDDDPHFDEGQFIFGTIGGVSVQDLVRQCDGLAKIIYKDQGSSGLKNVVTQ